MHWIEDPTGRFLRRPWFEDGEIDALCEALLFRFLSGRSGGVAFPIPTSELTVFVEQHVEDLDTYADLSHEGDGVEGATYFSPSRLPVVKINSDLSIGSRWWHEHRLRTTLMHEMGHVLLHTNLTRRSSNSGSAVRLVDYEALSTPRDIDGIGLRPKIDWMEWQAAYASGAFLMPRTSLYELAARSRSDWKSSEVPLQTSARAADLIRLTSTTFQVSTTAATVRLRQQGLIVGAIPRASRRHF